MSPFYAVSPRPHSLSLSSHAGVGSSLITSIPDRHPIGPPSRIQPPSAPPPPPPLPPRRAGKSHANVKQSDHPGNREERYGAEGTPGVHDDAGMLRRVLPKFFSHRTFNGCGGGEGRGGALQKLVAVVVVVSVLLLLDIV